MMKKITLLLGAFCLSFSLFAQDIHFSQFYMSPLNLNPAMTGVMNCNVRLTANYRNQWSSIVRSGVYNTYSASYDQRFTSGRYDYFGLGATVWGDQAGSANFGTTTFKVSGSYAKRMAGNRRSSHYLSFGFEGGVAQRRIDFLALRWGTQWDGDAFNETLGSGETSFDQPNFTFIDAAAGLLWFSNFGDNANLYVGGSYHHLNRANQSFSSNQTELLYSRFTVHAGGEVPLTNRIGLVPGVIAMIQGPSLEINSGASIKFALGNSRFNTQAFHVGAWTRIGNRPDGVLNDAVILSTRFDYNEYSLGFSYDLNVSPLVPGSNGQGGFELALQYKFCGNERRGVYCPNF
jgi:type IX secretion system PorP/SprF family membrane protein